MKKLLATAAFAALASASGSAVALDMDFTVTAPSVCVVPGAAVIGPFAVPINPDGKIDPITATLATINGAYCTDAANISISTKNGAITLGNVVAALPAAPSGFANRLPYTATASWSTLSAVIDADGTAGAATVTSADSTGAVLDALTVAGSTLGSALPMVAGAYSDTLTVTLNPV
jgi:hypothetical protein